MLVAPIQAPATSAPAVNAPPPPSLPGEHFAAALVLFSLGATGLVWTASDLALGAFFVPRVIATVHLFTLGWIILSIFGALCQFLPVAIGRSLRWPALAHVSFGLQVAGTLSFASALLLGDRTLLMLAGSALAAAFVLFTANLATTLARATRRSVTWWALCGACVFLLATPAYGLVLALNLHHDLLGVERFAFVARHAHVAVVGVVLLVAVGVAHKLLPMFLLSHGAKEGAARVAVALLFSSAAILAVPFGGGVTATIAGVLAAAGVAAFLVQAASFLRHAKRRSLDPGMKLAAAGLVGLGAAVLLAPFALSRGLAATRLLATYHLVLIGALSLFVAGHYYKIVPFLVWYHRFGPLVGKRKVPKVAELYSERIANLNAALLVGGWLGLVVGTATGLPVVVQAGGAVFAAGALLELVVIARVARRRPA